MNRLFFKAFFSVILLVILASNNMLEAQISQGGTPLFYAPPLLKSGNNFFIEMPSFNVDSLLQDDKLNESNMRGAFRFANKFYVNIEKGKSGYNYILPDGTKIWQVGIRSQGAYSINVFFSEYKVPPGGKLFLYNSTRTSVIGSFTEENNSEGNILPIQPVAGDEIIVEYQEPANSEFEAKLKISEVNHDYKGLLNYEPKIEPISGSSYSCMPDILCVDPSNNNIRSAVLITINGDVACSGSLLNTTNNDGEPVLLTAIHCLNDGFKKTNVDYTKVAGTIVCFFNYNKPVCNQTQSAIQRMKGTEEMSLAGAVPLSIIVKNDMALLRLNNKPPDYYMPYYAGWNIATDAGNNTPFINIHHPSAFVSKYGDVINPITIGDFSITNFDLNPQSHWKIPKWNVGATIGGSSGSPLFDNHGLVIGGLSGGTSACSNGSPNNAADYFFALYKSWNYTPDVGILLKDCLDPNDLGVTQWNAFDPYKDTPLARLKNRDYNNGDELVNSKMTNPNQGLVFGPDSLKMKEFAEEFVTDEKAELVGAYLLTPLTVVTSSSGIKVKAYKGSLSDENLIASETFYPTYWDFDVTSANFMEKQKTMSSVSTESFVKFREEVDAGTKFYVSYEITYPSARDFSVYNMVFDSPEKNSAWLRDANGNWLPATRHPVMPMSAALTIEPLVRFHPETKLSSLVGKKDYIFYLKTSRQLQINTDNPDEKGVISIYSIAGQLLHKISYSGNNPVNIPGINNTNVIIVKALSESGIKTSKIVL